MPFTIGGDWISPTDSGKNSKPVKVRSAKRGKNIVTVVHNLNFTHDEMVEIASVIKRKLGCGGAVKEEDKTIEFQGDKVEQVVQFLKTIGLNPQ